MNMVPYNQEVFNRYSNGDTFKVKLRCGHIETGRIFKESLMVDGFAYFPETGRYYCNKDCFADIVEIEAKPFKIKVGKVYISDSKYPPSTYKIEAKVLDVYIGFCIENHNNIVMFNEDGTVNDGTVNFRNSKHYSNLVKEV